MRQDLATSLADVRMAYRLIGEYEARLFAILKFVERRFSEFEFFQWAPVYLQRLPRKTQHPLNYWSSCGVPYFSFSMIFTMPGVSRSAESIWMFEIHHEADDGLQKEDFVNENSGPDFSRLDPVSESHSEIHLLAWRRNPSAEDADWFSLWENSDWPEKDDVLEDAEDGRLSIIRRRIDVSTLSNRDDVEAAVEDFRRLLTSVGVPLVSADDDRVTV